MVKESGIIKVGSFLLNKIGGRAWGEVYVGSIKWKSGGVKLETVLIGYSRRI